MAVLFAGLAEDANPGLQDEIPSGFMPNVNGFNERFPYTLHTPNQLAFHSDDKGLVFKPKACGFSPMIAPANQRGT